MPSLKSPCRRPCTCWKCRPRLAARRTKACRARKCSQFTWSQAELRGSAMEQTSDSMVQWGSPTVELILFRNFPNPMTIKWGKASFSDIPLAKISWCVISLQQKNAFLGCLNFVGDKHIDTNRLSRSHKINQMKSPCPPQAPCVLHMKQLADALRTGVCAQSHGTGRQLIGIPGESQRP